MQELMEQMAKVIKRKKQKEGMELLSKIVQISFQQGSNYAIQEYNKMVKRTVDEAKAKGEAK
jgi:hypothetical protein